MLSIDLQAKTIGEEICQQDGFECVTVQKGQTWKSLYSDENHRNILQRLNRMNTGLRAGMVIAVPKNLSQVTLRELAPYPLQDPNIQEKTFVFDPKKLAWAAYDDTGKLINWGPASGGKDFCADVGYACRTKVGDFRIYAKGGAKCKSSTYPVGEGGAPMPYCQFFFRGYAIHGSTQVPGYHASHGCVRVFVDDAKWLSENFTELKSHNTESRATRVLVLGY